MKTKRIKCPHCGSYGAYANEKKYHTFSNLFALIFATLLSLLLGGVELGVISFLFVVAIWFVYIVVKLFMPYKWKCKTCEGRVLLRLY